MPQWLSIFVPLAIRVNCHQVNSVGPKASWAECQASPPSILGPRVPCTGRLLGSQLMELTAALAGHFAIVANLISLSCLL